MDGTEWKKGMEKNAGNGIIAVVLKPDMSGENSKTMQLLGLQPQQAISSISQPHFPRSLHALFSSKQSLGQGFEILERLGRLLVLLGLLLDLAILLEPLLLSLGR